MTDKTSDTPLMKQYTEFKEKYPDALLLFRVGDFYETFGDDAIKASEALGITLTKRGTNNGQPIPLAGFPHHALDTYLPKLVRWGYRVAVCDQLEDPKLTKKLVKRGVTELVTPGVVTGDNILDPRENNFLAAIHVQKNVVGVSFLDLSTGEFYLSEGTKEYVEKLLASFSPKEVLVEYGTKVKFQENYSSAYLAYELDDWIFTKESATDRLLKHFNTTSLKGFGVETLLVGQIAAGAILHYLDITQHTNIKHITSIRRIQEEKYMWMDRFTVRNLEIFGGETQDSSLARVLNKAITPMGSRLMFRWIAQPLRDLEKITQRHRMVESFFKDVNVRGVIAEELAKIGDMERIISRVASLRATPRDMITLASALRCVTPIKEACATSSDQTIVEMSAMLNACEELSVKIEQMIEPESPISIKKGNVIRAGYNEELDHYRNLSKNSIAELKKIEEDERVKNDIPSLKLGYNNVFGYYLEVRNTHKDKVPAEWIRKQTLTGAERYITEQLHTFEEEILKAESLIQPLEEKLFNDLLAESLNYITYIQTNTIILSQLDCIHSFYTIANEYHYVCPVMNDGFAIDIKDGRHPVIERQLPVGQSYIANSVYLDNETQQIMMITGPNMAGKSALLRQTALIVIMAQIGSFVPAESATIGVVDKVFTRVGASDNIAQGESTFMVEMSEAANIVNNITSRSLVLFDELGRGTSTYDGISIAWSIVEYLHENERANPKTLFATHYHELNEMEKTFGRIKNFNVSVREDNGKVVFLRKLAKGGSEHSFGIHVAKIAGMPMDVVERANEILAKLEGENHADVGSKMSKKTEKALVKNATKKETKVDGAVQLSMFALDDPLVDEVRQTILNVDINNLTPLEALNKLSEIKGILTR